MKKTVFIAVLGLAINKEGKYLLTKRHEPNNLEVHHKWQLPGGGLEFGEMAEQVLSREMEEELKVSVRILFPYPMVRSRVWEKKDKKIQIFLLAYLVDLGQQKPVIGDSETADFGWFTPQEAQKLDYLPLTIEFVTEAEQIVKKEKILEMLK